MKFGVDIRRVREALPPGQCDVALMQSPYSGVLLVGLGDGSVRSVSSGVSALSWNLAVNPADGRVFDSTW